MMLPSQFNIMPVRDKKPLMKWENLISCTQTSEEKDAILYAGTPGTVGIICGPVSRIFVLDIDGPDGEASLQDRHVPKSWTVKTPHGKHVYFKWIPELDNKVTTRTAVLKGVDVRGEGGYVVFYGWERGPHLTALMAPPQWLIDLLPNKNAPKIIGDSFKKLDHVEALQNLKEGNRNDTFARLAGSLRARGFEFKEIYEFLFPKAKEVGFDERELQTVCQSICRYPAGQRPPVSEVLIPDGIEAFLQDEQHVEYLVPGVFAKESISFVAGLPESCKTWTLLDLAVELARKKDGNWLGRFPVNPTKVLYIDQERAKSETQRRFKALIAAKGLSLRDLNDSLVVKCGTTIRLNLKESFDSFRNLLTKVRPGVILVDSFKTFHTNDINSNVQMQEVMEKIKALKNEFGCSFIFIFHENKGAHERVDANGKKKAISFDHMAGAAVMSEVPETILVTIKQEANSSWLHHVKNTYGTKIAPVVVAVEDTEPNKIKVMAR